MIPKEKTGLEKEAFDWATKGVFDLMFPESQKEAAAKGYMGGVLAEREACAKMIEGMASDFDYQGNSCGTTETIAEIVRNRSNAHAEL